MVDKSVAMWVKGSIEHRSLLIDYRDEEGAYTRRIIYPDWVEQTQSGTLLWGWDPQQGGPRSFYRHRVRELRYHGLEFTPNPVGKYKQLQKTYDRWKLKDIPWKKEPEDSKEEDNDDEDPGDETKP